MRSIIPAYLAIEEPDNSFSTYYFDDNDKDYADCWHQTLARTAISTEIST